MGPEDLQRKEALALIAKIINLSPENIVCPEGEGESLWKPEVLNYAGISLKCLPIGNTDEQELEVIRELVNKERKKQDLSEFSPEIFKPENFIQQEHGKVLSELLTTQVEQTDPDGATRIVEVSVQIRQPKNGALCLERVAAPIED